MIELLLAMTMLNIGLLAVVAAFSSGIVSLNRASRITTAAVLADGQMELYRAITYPSIRLEPSSIPRRRPVHDGHRVQRLTGDRVLPRPAR